MKDLLTDLFDDHVREFLIPRIMYAVEQYENGDPLKDFLEEEDVYEGLSLLSEIGKILDIKPSREG